MFIDDIYEKGIYLGSLKILESGLMKFSCPHMKENGQKNRKFFIDLGDIVYFMFVNGKLMKIGKTGNWYNRVYLYEGGNGPRGDQTNCNIIDCMNSIGEDVIEVYAIKSPKKEVIVESELLDEAITVEVETSIVLEKKLTAKFLNESVDNVLPFCRQLK